VAAAPALAGVAFDAFGTLFDLGGLRPRIDRGAAWVARGRRLISALGVEPDLVAEDVAGLAAAIRACGAAPADLGPACRGPGRSLGFGQSGTPRRERR
jgi:hypothetical protein